MNTAQHFRFYRRLILIGLMLQAVVFISSTAHAAEAAKTKTSPSNPQPTPLNTPNLILQRPTKFDGRVQQLYQMQRARHLQPLSNQAQTMSITSGRPNPAVRDNQLCVTITFSRTLTEAELSAYEATGVRFMQTPAGELANFEQYYPAWVTETGMDALATDDRVINVEPGNSANDKPTLDISRTEVEADLRHNTPTWTDATGNRGAGVKVAVFDTGIDVHHPDFFAVKNILPYNWIDTNNNNLFDAGLDYVDINRNGSGQANERLMYFEPYASTGSSFGVYDVDTDWLYCDTNDNGTRDYGTSAGYTEADDCYGEPVFFVEDTNGNDRLDVGEKLVPLGKSKIRKVMVGAAVYTRGIDLIDTPVDQNGHGTSVCSIIVGQDDRYGRRFCGIAPDAELYVVDRYASPNHLATLVWARNEGARLFLWEFGGWIQKYLDGSTALENAISTGTLNAGEIHVVPNGNLGASDRHAVVTGGGNGSLTSIDFTVPNNVSATNVYISVLWRDAGDNVQFDLAPTGSANFTRINAIPKSVGGNSVTGYPSTSTRSTHRFDLYMANNSGIAQGSWTLRIQNANPTSATFHLWVDENDQNITWSGGAKWLSNVTVANTISWPATADFALNVASYSTKTIPGQLSNFSGRGPRLDGFELNDIAAPGHYDITCARSRGATNNGAWGAINASFGGTSAAGPHVTGAAALLIQAVPNTPGSQIIDALLVTAEADGYTGATPNADWGYGKLRIDQAYDYLVDERCPIISEPTPMAPLLGSSVSPDEPLELRWQPAANAQLYDLYFGDTVPPRRYVAGLTNPEMTIVPAALEPDTTYYWYIAARNSCGYTQLGPISSFSTDSSTSGPEIEVVASIFVDQNTRTRETLAHNDEFDFGPVEVGQSVTQVFFIHNAGDADLHLTGNPRVQLSGSAGEYAVAFQPFSDTVVPNQDMIFSMTFAPTHVGLDGAQVQIWSDDADESFTRIHLVGEGFEETQPIDPNEPTADPNEPVDPNEPTVDPNEPVIDPNEPVIEDPNQVVVDDPNEPLIEDPNDMLVDDPNTPLVDDPNNAGFEDPNDRLVDDPNQAGKELDPNGFEQDPNDPNMIVAGDDDDFDDMETQVVLPAPCGLGLIAPALIGFAGACCANKRRRKEANA